MPGNHTDENYNMTIMNSMCDMSQFVVVIPVPDGSSITLASYFIQHVLMKFGIYHLVVLDDGTPFKIAFIVMYHALNLNYEILVKRNHKGFSIEYFLSIFK